MRHLTIALAAAACLALSTPASAGPAEDFQQLMDDYWAAYLKDNPLTASGVGIQTYDRELGELSLAEFDRQMPPPRWPALMEQPIRIDVPSDSPWRTDQEYVYWSN